MNKTMAKQITIGEQSRGVNKYENHHFFFYSVPVSHHHRSGVQAQPQPDRNNTRQVGNMLQRLEQSSSRFATVSMWHWFRAASTKRSLKMRPINMTALNNDITGTQRFCASLEPPIIAGITTRRLTRAT
jgi:chloramphenicol O-acetyltransferase